MAQTINTAVTRTDAPRTVTGTATYAADVMPSGILHGAIATSPIAVDSLTALDTSRAIAESGVIAVFTHETLPDYKSIKGFLCGRFGSASFWAMEGTDIRYAGQPIAYVSHPGRRQGCFLNGSGFGSCQSFIACKGVLLPGADWGCCWSHGSA